VESSTHRLSRLYPAIAASLASLGALGWLVMGSVDPAQGYTNGPPSPALLCALAGEGQFDELKGTLAPYEGTTVTMGTPVTFSGDSPSPVTFAVASSPALLSHPDIDGGPGSAEPTSSRPPPTYAYTFTSTKATATPRVVYWDASFSNADIAECSGQPLRIYTTPVQVLTVVPVLSSRPSSAPPPSPAPPRPLTAVPPVQVSVSGLKMLHRARPTVTYRVHCTARCSGETYYQVLVVRRHGKAVRAPKLDRGPKAVSIAPAAGGYEQFTYIYRGSSVRMLRAIVRSGGKLELRVTVQVAGV
jgi:hypothetical protein